MHASVSIPAHSQSAIASVIEQMADVSPPTHAGWSGGGKLIGAEGGDTGASGGGGVGGGIGDSISDSGGGDEGGVGESTSGSGEATSERRCSLESAFAPSRRRAFTRWSRNGAASLRSIVVAVQSTSRAPCST
eukprot:scaffold3461_cov61-Phaeocystis_antarctica.AAC.1